MNMDEKTIWNHRGGFSSRVCDDAINQSFFVRAIIISVIELMVTLWTGSCHAYLTI